MRRSILIVMLDVMVLSVLALTARQRAGGGTIANIPVPTSGISRMVEEGLRNEASFRDEISRLETQLKEASAIAQKALDQAALAEAKAGRESEESDEVLEKLRAMELAAERARADATLAKREAELVNEQAALAKERTRELELREAEAKARAHELALRELEAKARTDAALARLELAEDKALEAELLAQEAERSAGDKDSEVLALQQEMMAIRAAQLLAEERAEALSVTLSGQEAELSEARTDAASARATAQVAMAERERMVVKTEQVAEQLVQTRETMATLQERKKGDAEKIAQFQEEKRAAVEEESKSVWVQREEALRRVQISYTEYNSANGQSFRTSKELVMPLVKLDQFLLVPAEFKELGLKRSFFGGLSESITDVKGVLSPMVGEAKPGTLNAVIVPAAEPQVCLVHSVGEATGALVPVTMQGLKEQRLQTALLFSPDDEEEYGQVDISPVLGRDYLNVRAQKGKKPKTGDYLLTERGEFIGVMVKSDICSVLPGKLTGSPKPVIIPLRKRGKNELYLNDFVRTLNVARDRLDAHLDVRNL
ncbi:coiled-coil domain-containing protein [Pontiella sulfatireligans]|uniref:Uncharacterized protein n=1 Tax=Pontiella sulfatireligans TaxID=2750658 RepID=A0A6C2UMZ1_9BACT|nr:hypothetical protein [Pontiella sulfatireligans]VGO21313.1 hypothetical protein SCARR_03385 [Pontiella sulfatireligans]